MNKENLGGIHHVTAITSNAQEIYHFYTNILGMRLVKKNVNQDDLSTYHLFFADDRGNPGTDMTFFDFKGIPSHQKGTNDISTTTFRVSNDEALEYWLKRFDHYDVKHTEIHQLFDMKLIFFEDFDEQHYALVSDENIKGINPGIPWIKGPVPNEFAIVGLGPIFLTVNSLELINGVLTQILEMKQISKHNNFYLYEMGLGGNGGRIIVEVNDRLPIAQQGYGGVHHVAFRVKDDDQLHLWNQYLNDYGIRTSGIIDRYYFKSVYVRLYPNILFEFATDGPGFIDDQEYYEILGETLTLPPHLRDKKDYIETQLKYFDTVRSNKIFNKEYFE